MPSCFYSVIRIPTWFHVIYFEIVFCCHCFIDINVQPLWQAAQDDVTDQKSKKSRGKTRTKSRYKEPREQLRLLIPINMKTNNPILQILEYGHSKSQMSPLWGDLKIRWHCGAGHRGLWALSLGPLQLPWLINLSSPYPF